jgi:hypothetical protein
MWTIKSGGKSYYINHLTSTLPWSTKETPNNEATKGSIKFKNCLLKINDQNEATLSELTEEDRYRLKKAKDPFTRIIMTEIYFPKIKKYLDDNKIKYSKFKKVTSGCGSWTYYISDVAKKEDMVMLCLVFSNNEYRILQENEEYYKFYDKNYYAYLTALSATAWPQPTPESNSTIRIWNSYDGDGVTTDQKFTHDLISANDGLSNTAPVYAQANGALVGSDTTTIETNIPYFNTSMNSNKYYFTGTETIIMIVTLNSNNAGLVYSETTNRIIEINNGHLHIYWNSTNNINTPYSVTGTAVFLPNTTYIISTNINNNTGQIFTFVNGLADINTTYTSQIPMESILNRSKITSFGIGAKMWINEILVYSSVLSANLRQNYEGFLSKKWNIDLDDKNHPFYVISTKPKPVLLLSPAPSLTTINSPGSTLNNNLSPTSGSINNPSRTLSPVSTVTPNTSTPSLVNGLTDNQLYIIIGVVVGGILLLYFMTGSSNNNSEEYYRPRSRSRSRSRYRD